MSNLVLSLALLLTGCGDKDDDTGSPGTDGGATDGGGADGGGTDGGTDGGGGDGGADGGGGDGGGDGGGGDGGGDGGSEELLGLLEYTGSATVLGNYAGTESLVFTSDEGDGEVICRFTYALSGATARTDCPECDWAFDVTVGKVTVDTDMDGACASIGWDEAARSALTGGVRGYGYIAEYFGHAPVLMTDSKGSWEPVTFASYEPGTGAFSYAWEVDVIPYTLP